MEAALNDWLGKVEEQVNQIEDKVKTLAASSKSKSNRSTGRTGSFRYSGKLRLRLVTMLPHSMTGLVEAPYFKAESRLSTRM